MEAPDVDRCVRCRDQRGQVCLDCEQKAIETGRAVLQEEIDRLKPLAKIGSAEIDFFAAKFNGAPINIILEKRALVKTLVTAAVVAALKGAKE